MATPLKPWERTSRVAGGVSATADSTGLQVGAKPTGLTGSGGEKLGTSRTPPALTSVPTVPPRVAGGGSGYFSSQPYVPNFAGSYGGLGGYGNYGYGYRPYGGGMGMYGGAYGNNLDSPFVRQAEESTRTAFQSVESVVGAFSSISAMLESTYMALHSCFRAVLGVAQHFSRLKNQLWGILSAVAILHRLRHWIKRLLRLLRLRRSGEREELWEEMVSGGEHPEMLRQPASIQKTRMWPTVLFFTIIFGVPWLLWKLMASIATSQAESSNEWHDEGAGEQTKVTARALYDFTPQREDELGFSAGDELVLAPRQLQSGWVLAGKDRKSGLVPVNYVQIQTTGRAVANSSHSPDSGSPLSAHDGDTMARTQMLRAEETLLND